jgi:hypothetical protein
MFILINFNIIIIKLNFFIKFIFCTLIYLKKLSKVYNFIDCPKISNYDILKNTKIN